MKTTVVLRQVSGNSLNGDGLLPWISTSPTVLDWRGTTNNQVVGIDRAVVAGLSNGFMSDYCSSKK
jgi:hypothetical protein